MTGSVPNEMNRYWTIANREKNYNYPSLWFCANEIPFECLMNSVSFFPSKDRKIYEKIEWFFNKLIAKVKEMGGTAKKQQQ